MSIPDRKFGNQARLLCKTAKKIRSIKGTERIHLNLNFSQASFFSGLI